MLIEIAVIAMLVGIFFVSGRITDKYENDSPEQNALRQDIMQRKPPPKDDGPYYDPDGLPFIFGGDDW